tara:strand:- start:5521 stop:5700 length:180 start_codon:yes stop_codon:yes gene_type:complete
LPYVSVELKESIGNTVGAITDDKGVFEIEKISQGAFIVSISFIGYKTLLKNIVSKGKNI